ncbi:MAG: AAA family ATPase, partial [Solirubrobacterales bacterium]
PEPADARLTPEGDSFEGKGTRPQGGRRPESGADRTGFLREHFYQRPVIDGVEASDKFFDRAGRWLRSLTTSGGERREAEIGAELAAATVSRVNRIAVVSPKGGVGKTTCTFLLGNILASYPRLRVLALDANRDFGTLAELAPEHSRSKLTLAHLLDQLDSVCSTSDLGKYVSRLPSGLHILAAPRDARVMATMEPALYGEVLEFVSIYYDVVLLDLGTGVVDPLAQFGLDRADQAVVITAPEFVTTEKVLSALRYIGDAGQWTGPDGESSITVAVNRVPKKRAGDLQEIQTAFRRAGAQSHVEIPQDEQLRVMMDSATYTLESLRRDTRMPIKLLGRAITRKLV